MSTSEARKPGPSSAQGFALVMESDVDLRGMICSALLREGHRVESVSDCAGVLAFGARGGPPPDDFVLALGAGEADPEWETLRAALDQDSMLSRAAIIVLVTIRNGLRFPERARILQKPFAVDELLALVAADVTASRRRSVGP